MKCSKSELDWRNDVGINWQPSKSIIGDYQGYEMATPLVDNCFSFVYLNPAQSVIGLNPYPSIDSHVDFIITAHLSDGTEGLGGFGAGFLRDKLKYTGIAEYEKKKGIVVYEMPCYFDHCDNIKDINTFREAVNKGRNAEFYRKLINSLPSSSAEQRKLKGRVKELFFGKNK